MYLPWGGCALGVVLRCITLTLVYPIDQGFTRLLRVGTERTLECFRVSSPSSANMWQPYLVVIRQKCSQALHILDRFHIVAKMNKAFG
jgi:transposase